jgi:hypothetical protein
MVKIEQMETCAQCKGLSVKNPVVIIQKLDLEDFDGLLAISDNNEWMARSVCYNCWQQPQLKGHFHYNDENMINALNRAGSSNLGG